MNNTNNCVCIRRSQCTIHNSSPSMQLTFSLSSQWQRAHIKIYDATRRFSFYFHLSHYITHLTRYIMSTNSLIIQCTNLHPAEFINPQPAVTISNGDSHKEFNILFGEKLTLAKKNCIFVSTQVCAICFT